MELISVHVPKTAGTAFANLLNKVYGVEQIFKDYENESIESIGPRYRVVHGHFRVGKYNGYFPTAKRVAWVRHPATWVISLYYFWKHIPWEVAEKANNPLLTRHLTEELSLLEFAEHPLARNQFTRHFLDGLDLEDFFFVGIQEHFQEELKDLAWMMGWPTFEVGVDNANPQPGYRDRVNQLRSEPGLIQKLESLNEDDMALYERALTIRSRRVRINAPRWVVGCHPHSTSC